VEEALAAWREEGARILWARRHQNKLRSGHLKGNRFALRIRKVANMAAGMAAFDLLCTQGLPNYFGEQRFGAQGNNAERGKALLLGQRLPHAPGRFERRLYLSAYQARLFNQLLAQRLEEGTLSRAFAGDVLRKEETGGLFVCQDAKIDQERMDRWELSPAGPLFGPKLVAAQGPVRDREEALLRKEGMSLSDFVRGRGETEGARRAYRVAMGAPERRQEGDDLLLSFTLPPGSYATVVLDEVVKGVPRG
jgi:tRNA pseudouridine13 synthase